MRLLTLENSNTKKQEYKSNQAFSNADKGCKRGSLQTKDSG